LLQSFSREFDRKLWHSLDEAADFVTLTLRIGLRKIIRDPRASVRTRLQAIRLLMGVEGLSIHAKSKPSPAAKNGATSKKLRELFASIQEQKPQEVLPGAPSASLRQ
jgi:hypothetical protein